MTFRCIHVTYGDSTLVAGIALNTLPYDLAPLGRLRNQQLSSWTEAYLTISAHHAYPSVIYLRTDPLSLSTFTLHHLVQIDVICEVLAKLLKIGSLNVLSDDVGRMTLRGKRRLEQMRANVDL